MKSMYKRDEAYHFILKWQEEFEALVIEVREFELQVRIINDSSLTIIPYEDIDKSWELSEEELGAYHG